MAIERQLQFSVAGVLRGLGSGLESWTLQARRLSEQAMDVLVMLLLIGLTTTPVLLSALLAALQSRGA